MAAVFRSDGELKLESLKKEVMLKNLRVRQDFTVRLD